MTNIYETYVTINGYEFAARILYRFYAGSEGRIDGGVPIEPNEPASVEIERVTIEHGDNGNFFEIDLPKIVLDEIAGEILGEEL